MGDETQAEVIARALFEVEYGGRTNPPRWEEVAPTARARSTAAVQQMIDGGVIVPGPGARTGALGHSADALAGGMARGDERSLD